MEDDRRPQYVSKVPLTGTERIVLSLIIAVLLVLGINACLNYKPANHDTEPAERKVQVIEGDGKYTYKPWDQFLSEWRKQNDINELIRCNPQLPVISSPAVHD